MSDEVAKLKGEIKALKEKLKKKSKRVSELSKALKVARHDKDFYRKEYNQLWNENVKIRRARRMMPSYYFTICYKTHATSQQTFSICVHEPCPTLEIDELMKKYPDFLLVSVTKTA